VVFSEGHSFSSDFPFGDSVYLSRNPPLYIAFSFRETQVRMKIFSFLSVSLFSFPKNPSKDLNPPPPPASLLSISDWDLSPPLTCLFRPTNLPCYQSVSPFFLTKEGDSCGILLPARRPTGFSCCVVPLPPLRISPSPWCLRLYPFCPFNSANIEQRSNPPPPWKNRLPPPFGLPFFFLSKRFLSSNSPSFTFFLLDYWIFFSPNFPT